MGRFIRHAGAVLFFLAAVALCSGTAGAQFAGSDKPPMLVMKVGSGGIVLPTGRGWKLDSLSVYDNGLRPVALIKIGDGDLAFSLILFENRSGEPTGQGCRKETIGGIVANLGGLISKRVDGETKVDGRELATTSYLFDMSPSAPGHFQHNLFGFAGSEKTCAEIHISSVRETAGTDERIKALLGNFHFDLGYQPTALDYFRMATILSKASPRLAVPYYQSLLDAMPTEESYKTLRRMATDRLVTAMGKIGR